jgi:hypothetical protein
MIDHTSQKFCCNYANWPSVLPTVSDIFPQQQQYEGRVQGNLPDTKLPENLCRYLTSRPSGGSIASLNVGGKNIGVSFAFHESDKPSSNHFTVSAISARFPE